ncbi:hypothetical protein ACRTEC_14610 [Janibacter indicus]
MASGGTVPGSLGSAGAAEGPLLLGAAGAAVDVALAVGEAVCVVVAEVVVCERSVTVVCDAGSPA